MEAAPTALPLARSNLWNRFQGEVVPELAEEVGPLQERHKHLVQVLDLVEVERFVDTSRRGSGWTQRSRLAPERACNNGARRNAEGCLESWRDDKLHFDTADCGVPVSAIVTLASVHDSNVATPLATTTERVTNLHDLMDAAFEFGVVHRMNKRLGHIPLIEFNPRRDTALNQELKREARARRVCGPVMPQGVRNRIRHGVEIT